MEILSFQNSGGNYENKIKIGNLLVSLQGSEISFL